MQKDINKDKVTIETQARFENVATALYLVTSHLPESEPLKNRVRIITHNVLEEFVSITDISTQVIFDHLSHVRSLLKIASVSGMISAQNVSLINSEILAIQSSIKDLQSTASSLSVNIGKVLMLDFVGESFPVRTQQNSEYLNNNHDQGISPNSPNTALGRMNISENPEQRKLQSIQIQKSLDNKNSLHTLNYINQNPTPLQTAQARAQIRNQAPNPKLQKEPQPSVQSKGVQISDQNKSIKGDISTGMTERQNNIVKEIKNKGQLTIRDLVGKITGCSEKTIQRELLLLVEVGILLKEGERRWSKYSVK